MSPSGYYFDRHKPWHRLYLDTHYHPRPQNPYPPPAQRPFVRKAPRSIRGFPTWYLVPNLPGSIRRPERLWESFVYRAVAAIAAAMVPAAAPPDSAIFQIGTSGGGSFVPAEKRRSARPIIPWDREYRGRYPPTNSGRILPEIGPERRWASINWRILTDIMG